MSKKDGYDPSATLHDFDRPTSVEDMSDPSSLPIALWVKMADRDFRIAGGRTTIGRSAECEITVDDALTSRKHAAFVCRPDGVFVEDLGSVNGVFVNGVRIAAPKRLQAGDRVLIGKSEISILGSPPSSPRGFDTQERAGARRAETLAKLETADQRMPAPVIAALDDSPSEATHRGHALDLLGGVADKVLALGRGVEAERVLSAYLHNALVQARAVKHIDPDIAGRAATYAVKIAVATGKGSWVDYAVELASIAKRPLPAPVVDELYSALRKVSAVDVAALRGYVALLQSMQERFGPTDKFLVQRIEGLARLAALR